MNPEELERLAEDPEIRDGAAAALLAKVRRRTREAKPGEIPEAVADQIQDAVVIESLREMLQAAERQGDQGSARVIRLAILKAAVN
jgi:hypothetical protein